MPKSILRLKQKLWLVPCCACANPGLVPTHLAHQLVHPENYCVFAHKINSYRIKPSWKGIVLCCTQKHYSQGCSHMAHSLVRHREMCISTVQFHIDMIQTSHHGRIDFGKKMTAYDLQIRTLPKRHVAFGYNHWCLIRRQHCQHLACVHHSTSFSDYHSEMCTELCAQHDVMVYLFLCTASQEHSWKDSESECLVVIR